MEVVERYQTQERRCNLILKIMRLSDIMKEHLHEDELAGYHYVIPKEKLDRVYNTLVDITEVISKEVNLKSHDGKALKNLIEDWKSLEPKIVV